MEGTLRPGAILLGKYRVESVLGRGGMGIVLRVTHLQLGEELAIKVLLPEGATNPEATARFLREAQSVVRLRGEHVAKVTDIGVLPEGVPFIVMEYLRGVDLAGELRRRQQLPPGEVVDYVLQACEALAEAHVHGIVHRDIKPANLFLTTRPDGTPLVKVLDFGISKAPLIASGLVTRTDTVMGTAGYMSPEQMKTARDVDARTDIWALGIVLYECLNGRRPFEGESFTAVVLMAGTEPPPPMDPRVPRGLQAAVLRCLEKDRRARFASIAELTAALAPFARDQRAAAMVVDRTKLMQQRPGSAAEPPPQESGPTATTLSGSAGPTASRVPGRRLATVLLVWALGVLVTTVAVVSRRSHPPGEEIGAQPPGVGAHDAAPTTSALVLAPELPVDASDDPANGRSAGNVVVDAPAVQAAAVPDDKAQRLAQCADLDARRKWQDLLDCASALDALGLEDKAKEFRTEATQETSNETIDAKIRSAVQHGSLKEAQQLLKGMSQDSIYYKSASDLFDKADNTNVEAAKRKVNSYLARQDCAGLKRFQSQQTGATGTERVVGLVNSAVARCNPEKVPPEPLITRTQTGKGSATQTGTSSGSVQPSPPQPGCDVPNVDEAVANAALVYNKGFSKTALSIMVKVLACKQSAHMYQLAALYACGARDIKSATYYFAKIPPVQQAGIEQRCQQEGLNVRGP